MLRGRDFGVVHKMSFIALIVAVGVGLFESVWALYLFHVFQSEFLVSIISAGMSILALVLYLYLVSRKRDIEAGKALVLSMLGFAVASAILWFEHAWMLLLGAGLLVASNVLRRETFGLILMENADQNKVGEADGVWYTLTNIGWLVGPILGSVLLARFGYDAIFVVMGACFIVATLFFQNIQSQLSTVTLHFSNLRDTWKTYASPGLLKAYVYGGLTTMYWTVIYVYGPLILTKLRVEDGVIVALFSAMMLPLILFEYVFGEIADSWGAENIIVLGLLLLGFTTVLAWFLSSQPYWLMSILIVSAVFVAMLEGNTEAYYYEEQPVKGDGEGYAVFNASFVGFGLFTKLVGSGIVVFLDVTAMLLFVGLSCAAGASLKFFGKA